MSSSDGLDALSNEYREYCAKHNLPAMSADELLCEDIDNAHTDYLIDFLRRWELVVDK